MPWLKHLIVDVVVLCVIVAASFLPQLDWLRGVVIGYTALMLLLKVLPLFMGGLLNLSQPEDPPPRAIVYGIYALCVLAPLTTGWWLVAGGWLAIAFLSLGAERLATPHPRAAS